MCREKLWFLIILIIIFLLSWEAGAQSQAKLGGLVLNLVCFFFFIFPALLTLLLVGGGFLILRGSRERRVQGKKLIIKGITAFFILIFLAWIVTLTSPDLNFGDYAPCFTGGESPRYPVSTTLRENLGPWADARGSPFPPLPLPQEKEVYTGPGEVYFDGSKSIDFDGSIAEYEWDFGQGTVKEGVSVSYIYSEEGDYLVKLTVTDDDDLDDVDVVRVYIHPLEAHIIKPTNEAVFYQIPDSEIIFLGEGKYGTPCTPPDDPYRYRWILDTSSFLSDEENFTRSASTLSKGPHELTLKVEDCKEKMAEDKVLIYIVERKVSAQILEPSKDGEVVDCDGKFKGNVSGGLPPYKVKWKAEGIVFDEGTINVEFGVHETSKRPTPGTVDITFEAEDQYSDRGEDEKKNIEIASCNPCDDFKVTGKLPEKFDWRKWEGRNYNSPVKDQGYCGSCWAHSALGSMEGIHEVEQWDPDLNPDLSEQYLVSDCCEGNCNGGRPDTAFSYIQGEGVSGEDCYPYRASNSPCSERCPDWSSRLWKIASHGSVSSNRDEIKEALICRGPLSVCSDNWMHCIVLSGYDDGEDYWIIKNSWGPSWGEGGYGKIGYKSPRGDLVQNVFYPEGVKPP